MLNKPAPPQNSDPFMKGPPGWSLTQPQGKWPWESPPRYTDPEEVVEMIMDKLDREEVRERYVKLMLAGVSIEEITKSITMAGFMEGQFSPDVAELIKAPVAIYLMKIADDDNLPVNVFAQDPAQDQKSTMSDATILDLMRRRNPEFHNFVVAYEPEEERIPRERANKSLDGFLAVDEDVELSGEEE
tara:strand:- start:505 stop:1065 length:561 start_codon:yes stop_codon:yes gene_type:complete